MFDKKWNVLIGVLVIVLMFSYFRNCTEGFAGAVEARNAEAIANVAALYNKDFSTVTNLTTTGNLTVNGIASLNVDKWHTSTDGKFRTYYGKDDRTYYGSQNGYEWRDKTDKANMTLSNDGILRTRDGANNRGINFGTNRWESAAQDNPALQSAIVNDTTTDAFKKLMIVGNSSAGGVRRVGVWDQLDVYGKFCIGNTCIDEGQFANLLNNTIKVNDPIAINSMMNGSDSGCFIAKKYGGGFGTNCTGVDTPTQGSSDSAHGSKFKIIRYPY